MGAEQRAERRARIAEAFHPGRHIRHAEAEPVDTMPAQIRGELDLQAEALAR